jgi:hypothetical protein
MKKYFIDGNNLIGKIKSVANIHAKDKQASREKIAYLVDRYFTNKKIIVFLHFDGFENRKIKVNTIKIVYSENLSADEKIKKQIELEKNNRNTVVVSSDNGIKDFAKVCGCNIILSEDFGKEITKTKNHDDEETRIKEINDVDTFRKIFNV